MPDSGQQAPQQPDDRRVADLFKDFSEQTSTLIRKELELARAELTAKGKRAGIGAGLFGGSGVVALYGVGALIAALVLLLATAVTAWLAALIVAVALFALAGVLALTGKKQVEQATPPVPEQAIESAQQDVETVKERAGRG
jgi:Putative Actinobacterial Holin-X, holin superfamily III